MAPVQGGNLRFAQALDEGEDAGIHHAKAEVRVGLLQVAGPAQISCAGPLNVPCPSLDVLNKGQPGSFDPQLATPVIKLGQHQPGDDEILGRRREQAGTGHVVGIVAIQGRQQRPGIADQGHLARVVGDGLSREDGRAGGPAGTGPEPQTGTLSATQRGCLFLDGFSHDHRQRDSPAACLSL